MPDFAMVPAKLAGLSLGFDWISRRDFFENALVSYWR